MSVVPLAQIESTIKANKEAEKREVKMQEKKEERDRFAVKKLPQHSGAFNFRPAKQQMMMYQPPKQLCEWKEGFKTAGIESIIKYGKNYGCDENILRKELTKSEDLKILSDKYVNFFDGLPDLMKGGLTVFSKMAMSKYKPPEKEHQPKQKIIIQLSNDDRKEIKEQIEKEYESDEE